MRIRQKVGRNNLNGSPLSCKGPSEKETGVQSPAMTHMYWTIVCKNKDCSVRHDVEYIGNANPGQIFARGWTKPFDFQCDACGKNYNYTYGDVRLFPKAHPSESL